MRIVRIQTDEEMRKILDDCENILREGGIIVYPTETLYGICTDPYNKDAVKRVFRIKQRQKNQPISVAVDTIEMASRICSFDDVMEYVKTLSRFPVTIVLPACDGAPPELVTSSGMIGVRFTHHYVAKAIVGRFGIVTSTSANISNGEEPVDMNIALKQLGESVDIYIDSGRCIHSQGSTVIEIEGDFWKVLRAGAMMQEIEKLCGDLGCSLRK